MSRRSLWLAVLAQAALVCSAHAAGKAAPVALAIVNPGGPDAGGEGNKLAAELAAHLAATAGLAPGEIEAAYFNQLPAAAAYLGKHKDAFVLGGLGVFLSQRRVLQLVPLARLVGKSGGDDELTVVVRKGRYGSLDDLRGKTLHGSVLADDARFVDRFVFGGKLQASTYFKCVPSERPLSALRKLGADEIDAVVLNRVQFAALAAMPLFAKLQAIHSSGPVPAVGLMMAATPRTRALRERIVQAVTKLCDTEKGAPVCQTYGITGFAPMAEDDLGAAIKQYEQR
jgi:hypothetical protein